MTNQQYDPDELETLLDALRSSETLRKQALSSNDPRLKAAAQLMTTPPPALSDDAKTRIRQKIEANRTASQPASPSHKIMRLPVWEGLAKLAAAVLIIFGLGFATSAAAAQSLPGEILYPVKQQLEDLELRLARTDEARASLYLKQANNRINETKRLLQQGQLSTATLKQAIDDLKTSSQLAAENDLYEQSAVLRSETAATYNALTMVLQDARTSETGEDEFSLADLNAAAVDLANANPVLSQVPPAATPDATPDTPAETTPETTPSAIITLPDDTELTEEAAVTPPVIVRRFIDAPERANIRSGPGIEFPVVTVAERGQPVAVIARDGEWVQIQFEDGSSGWIADYLLSETSPPPSSSPTARAGQQPPAASDNADNPDAVQPGDFGCEQPGNACNAPGRNRSNDQQENPSSQNANNNQAGNPAPRGRNP